VLDQAVLSLTNLALSLVVARSVDAALFGAFSLCFAVYTVTLLCARNIASQPLTIRFADRHADEVRRGASASAGAAVLVGLAVGAASAVAGLAVGGAVGRCLLALGLVLPGLLVQDTWRATFFARGEPRSAALLDLVWGVLQLGAVLLLVATDMASVALFVLGWGLAGCAAAVLGAGRTGARPRLGAGPRWVREHWDLTSFMLLEGLLLQGAYQGVLLVIGARGDLEGVGALRAAQVVNGPVTLLTASAFAFAVPELVRRAGVRDRRPLLVAAVVGGALATAAAAWNGVLLLLPDAAGEALLGDSWSGMRALLPAYAVGAVGNIVAVGPAVVVYAMGASRTSFSIHCVVAVLLTAGGLTGHHLAGAPGAAAGFAVGYCAVLPLWFWRLRVLARARQ
jgi:hypothetical protein